MSTQVHPFLSPLSVCARSVVGELLREVYVACPDISSRDAVAELRTRLDRLVLLADIEVGRKPVHAYDEIRRRLSGCAATGDGAALSWVSESLAFERLPESERERGAAMAGTSKSIEDA